MASPVPLPLRLLLIPAFAFGVFLAYAYGLAFFDSVIPRPQDRSLVFAALLAEGFAAAALVSLVFSYPLAFVYGRPAALAATAVALPVLFLRSSELPSFQQKPFSFLISMYEMFSFALLLIAGAWLAHGHLVRWRRAKERSDAIERGAA